MVNRLSSSSSQQPRESKAPREKLIETAAVLIYRQGWNATGINQILGDAQVPKGSFYYYFHSKEELGVAIVRHHAQLRQELYGRTLLNDAMPARAAIEKYFSDISEPLRAHEWRFGCPIGSFSNEVAATPEEKIAVACREALEAELAALTVAIARGQRDGSVSDTVAAPGQLALFVASAWQGAVLYSKTQKSGSPLDIVRDCALAKLFSR